MLKTIRLLTTTALIAAVPFISSYAGGYYISGSGSGIFSPKQDNTINWLADGSTSTITGSSSTVATTGAEYKGTLETDYFFGGGGSLGLGYVMPESLASFELQFGYDWHGKAEAKALEAKFYTETAVSANARATIPLHMDGSIAPYLGVALGIQQSMADDSDMDNQLAGKQLGENQNSCSGNNCPGYGNFKTGDKKKDIIPTASGILGVQLEVSPGMYVFAETAVNFGFQKAKMEMDDQEKTYLERSFVKYRGTIGAKYAF